MLHNRDGSPVPAAPHHVLPTDRVRHVGTAVAFVIAETIAAAKDAAEKVVVDYEPLPAVTEATAAVDAGAPRLYDDLPNIMIDAEVGDAAATADAFARAAHVTRLDTWINRVTGVPMEPRAAVGIYDAASGRYTLYAGSGGIVRQKRELAAILGVPVGKRARHRPRDRRQFRHAQQLLSRIRAGRLGLAARRAAGQMDRRTPRGVSSATIWAAISRCRAELALDADGRFLALRTVKPQQCRRP